MRPYETLVVLRTDLGEESSRLLSRFEAVITGGGGQLEANRDWGVRDLAYPIGKQRQGHYHLLEYQAEPTAVKELERNLRIVEGVLRFVSVQQDHTGLPEPRMREHHERRESSLADMRSVGHEEMGGERPAESENANGEFTGQEEVQS